MTAPGSGADDYHHGFTNDEYEGLEPSERNATIQENVLQAFTTPQGDFTLAWLYDIVRMGKTTFVAGNADQSAFNEGRRSVLLEIQGMMHLDDEELFLRARRTSRQLEKKS